MEKMELIVKRLNGGYSVIDVTEKTTVLELKKLVESDTKIPSSQQILMLMGKPLQDDKCMKDYPVIISGTRLSLAIKITEPLNTVLTRFLRKYYSEDQCKLIIEEFMRNFQSKVDSLSLDDLERIAISEIQN